VRRLKEAGADCIKVLLYYTPTDATQSMTRSTPGFERIGDECRANDIPTSWNLWVMTKDWTKKALSSPEKT